MKTNIAMKKKNPAQKTMPSRIAVTVTDSELEDIKRFFNDNPGRKTDCSRKRVVNQASLWRFLQTGRARIEIINRIRGYIRDYKEVGA